MSNKSSLLIPAIDALETTWQLWSPSPLETVGYSLPTRVLAFRPMVSRSTSLPREPLLTCQKHMLERLAEAHGLVVEKQ